MQPSTSECRVTITQSSSMKLPLSAAVLAASCLLVPASSAAPPAWWSVGPLTVLTAAPADDFAYANQGQLKHFTKVLVQYLNGPSGIGAGTSLNALVTSWATPTAATDDFSRTNVGQVKQIGNLVYDRMVATGKLFVPPGTTHAYPWTSAIGDDDDFAYANIGQIKQLFNFELAGAGDRDGDGLPDISELVFSKTNPDSADSDGDGIPDGREDTDGDGIINWQDYLRNTDGDDYSDYEEGLVTTDPTDPSPVITLATPSGAPLIR